MPTRRIFISSVMRDFGAERAAARDAVRSLRQEPVMAEDFGAQPFSSQTACLEGVRSSDLYVGIFGPRYGFVAPSSGLSATEEEFHEARRRGLPILCFEKKGSKEPAQEAFLAQIKAYETGYAFAFFESPEELKLEVVKAVHDLIGTQGVSMLDPTGATTHLERCAWGSRRPGQYGTWLGAALFPGRQGENYLDVLAFGQKDLRDRFLMPARFGPGTLFAQELGVQTSEEGDALVFRQGDDHRQDAAPVATLEIHADGTLVYGTELGREKKGSFSTVTGFVIDEEGVERLLTAFAHYTNQFYQSLPRGEVITSLYLGVSLTGIQMKSFGRLPTGPVQGVSMPMHGLSDPLKVPDAPLRLSRADLADPTGLSKKVTGHIARAFRQANAYFTSGGSGRAW
jgi:hypothetical protein